MNESDFEQQLRELRPVRPSRELESRIGRELAPAPTSRTWTPAPERRSLLERLLPALGWGSLGAAAAVVVMLSLNLANGGTQPTNPKTDGKVAVSPVSKAREGAGASVGDDLLEANDEGLLASDQIGVGRRVRYSSVERRSWKETDGAITVVEVPREDVVVLPVSFQ